MKTISSTQKVIFETETIRGNTSLTWVSAPVRGIRNAWARTLSTQVAKVAFRNGFVAEIQFTENLLLSDFIEFCAEWYGSKIHRIEFPD